MGENQSKKEKMESKSSSIQFKDLESFDIVFHRKNTKMKRAIGRFSFKTAKSPRKIKFYLNPIGNDLYRELFEYITTQDKNGQPKYSFLFTNDFLDNPAISDLAIDYVINEIIKTFIIEYLCGCIFTGNRFPKKCNYTKPSKDYNKPCIPDRIGTIIKSLLSDSIYSNYSYYRFIRCEVNRILGEPLDLAKKTKTIIQTNLFQGKAYEICPECKIGKIIERFSGLYCYLYCENCRKTIRFIKLKG